MKRSGTIFLFTTLILGSLIVLAARKNRVNELVWWMSSVINRDNDFAMLHKGNSALPAVDAQHKKSTPASVAAVNAAKPSGYAYVPYAAVAPAALVDFTAAGNDVTTSIPVARLVAEAKSLPQFNELLNQLTLRGLNTPALAAALNNY